MRALPLEKPPRIGKYVQTKTDAASSRETTIWAERSKSGFKTRYIINACIRVKIQNKGGPGAVHKTRFSKPFILGIPNIRVRSKR